MKREIKGRVIRRLKILEGQIRGLRKMVEKEEYCIDILQQSMAAKEALSGVEGLILENHLLTHIISGKVKDKKSAVKELTTLYRLKNR